MIKPKMSHEQLVSEDIASPSIGFKGVREGASRVFKSVDKEVIPGSGVASWDTPILYKKSVALMLDSLDL